jgi:hypothetical protein
MNEDTPEGVTLTVNVYLVSDTLDANTVIRIGEFKRLPPFLETLDAAALAKGLPEAADWRVMTREEIVRYTKNEGNAYE